MDSSFYTRVGEGKYEVHFETREKWKYTLVEAACREAIDHAKPLMVTENLVRCGECKHWSQTDKINGKRYGQCLHPHTVVRRNCFVQESFYCADGESEVQE